MRSLLSVVLVLTLVDHSFLQRKYQWMCTSLSTTYKNLNIARMLLDSGGGYLFGVLVRNTCTCKMYNFLLRNATLDKYNKNKNTLNPFNFFVQIRLLFFLRWGSYILSFHFTPQHCEGVMLFIIVVALSESDQYHVLNTLFPFKLLFRLRKMVCGNLIPKRTIYKHTWLQCHLVNGKVYTIRQSSESLINTTFLPVIHLIVKWNPTNLRMRGMGGGCRWVLSPGKIKFLHF